MVYEFDDEVDRSALSYKRNRQDPRPEVANGGRMAVWAIHLAKQAGNQPSSNDNK